MILNKIKEYSGLVALIAILLTWLIPAPTSNFGSSANGGNVTDYDAVNVIDGYYVDETQVINGSGFSVGPSTGTCSLIAPSFTVTASSTVAMDCAVTGVVSGDIVFAQFATSSAQFLGWWIDGASASSTSGYITVRVTNGLGVAAVLPASLASSTQYFISK